MKHLDGRSLAMLAATCKMLNHLIKDDWLWERACLRELNLQDPGQVAFRWNQLYASAFEGSHFSMFRQANTPVDSKRIGGFNLETPQALVVGTTTVPGPWGTAVQELTQEMLASGKALVINNVKPGIWLADVHFFRCPICQLTFKHCRYGRMLILDVRHIELFLCVGFQNGYELIGSYARTVRMLDASGAIFDLRHLNDPASIDIFISVSWTGRPNLLEPMDRRTSNAAVIHIYSGPCRGFSAHFYVMRAGLDRQVVSMRISHRFPLL